MNERRPRVLLLIPSLIPPGIETAVRDDLRPTMDYHALQMALDADIMDYGSLDADGRPALVRIARRAGRDVALAALGYAQRRDYDVIFANGENVGIPLAAMLRVHRDRPIHVLIGHRPSARKKRPFFRALHAQMDAIFVYATPQWEYARRELGIPASRLHLVPFHADHRFFRPQPAAPDAPAMICSAGLEWRDYPTLMEAAHGLDVQVLLGAASPWSKHRNETARGKLPPNVSARRYDYAELRQLYAESRCVVVPLYENDFQAGITTILEAMAMGKAVIASRTTGQVDTIRHEENGLYVAPGDASALRAALRRVLEDPAEAARLGATARRDIEASLSLDHWVARIVHVVEILFSERRCA
jgi:glycosyltransferase involved in cell wall biosynthesis